MNSIRCSKLTALLLVVTMALSAVAPVAAISTDAQGVPDDAKVGGEVSAELTLTDLYSDYERWTLNGETELTDVTWTVTTYDQAGNQKAKESYDGQSFNHSLALDSDASEAVVKVSGTVPEIENFTYDSQQEFAFATLSQTRDGGNSDEIQTWNANHHTEDSSEARTAIADAEDAIDNAPDGADTGDAEGRVENAISAYEAGNFGNAVDIAGQAEESANSATEDANASAQQSKLLMYGGVAVLGLVVIGGAGFWYRSQQQNTNRLR
ncbi:hypothetical protein ACFFQF_11080 [Haladaptatus pallidirubidus]|uniref:Uncharacterized protein n=1 Tax=Haladaptatus pallidirubidus TaxID=1008152 RepID=A0AAV3UEL4_9EURY|nr:hypothetical protein [Haladaptatus pallidirubidus]